MSAPPLCRNGNGSQLVGDLLAPYDIRLHEDWARRRKGRRLIRTLWRVGCLVTVDSVGITAAYLAAVSLQQQVLPTLIPALGAGGMGRLIEVIPAALGIHLLALSAFGTYAPGKHRRNYSRVVLAILLGTLLLSFASNASGGRGLTPTLFVLAGGVATMGVVSLRWVTDRLVIAFRRRHGLGRRSLLVGRADHIPQVRAHFDETPEANVRFVESLTFEGAASPARWNGLPDRLSEVLYRCRIEVVVVAGDPPNGMARKMLDCCLRAGCHVMLVPSVLHEIPNPVETEDLSGLFALAVVQPRLGLPQLALKRVFDLCVSTLGLVALSAFFALTALAIKLDSRGPVFFRQRRLGVGGNEFRIFKFRTMVADADHRKGEVQHLNQYDDGKFFKIKNDPRITRIGRLLRRTSLDELPQLINVVRGEMSLVGPRPPVPEEVVHYSEHHLQRLSVTPGITGLWQVSGRSDVLDFEEVVRLDLEYITSWSVWKDLTILTRTVPVVFRTRGAA